MRSKWENRSGAFLFLLGIFLKNKHVKFQSNYTGHYTAFTSDFGNYRIAEQRWLRQVHRLASAYAGRKHE